MWESRIPVTGYLEGKTGVPTTILMKEIFQFSAFPTPTR